MSTSAAAPIPEELKMKCNLCKQEGATIHKLGLFEENLYFHEDCHEEYLLWWTAEEQDKRVLQNLK